MIKTYYAQLYSALKGTILDRILDGDMNRRSREIVKEIARLPRPDEITREQLLILMRRLQEFELPYFLDFIYEPREMFEVWAALWRELERPPYDEPEPSGPISDDVLPTLHAFRTENQKLHDRSYLALQNLSVQLGGLSNLLSGSTKDRDMKGICPNCKGPLEEVIAPTNDPDFNELRLRCHNQTYDSCKQVEWVIQSRIPKIIKP